VIMVVAMMQMFMNVTCMTFKLPLVEGILHWHTRLSLSFPFYKIVFFEGFVFSFFFTSVFLWSVDAKARVHCEHL
jgi:hypothetical protein